MYGYTPTYVFEQAEAVRIALLYRCYSQGVGRLKSGTLLEDELALEMFGR